MKDLMNVLFAGFAFMLIFEGLMPLISPKRWREYVEQIGKLKDGQIRFIGMSAVMLGVFLLMFV